MPDPNEKSIRKQSAVLADHKTADAQRIGYTSGMSLLRRCGWLQALPRKMGECQSLPVNSLTGFWCCKVFPSTSVHLYPWSIQTKWVQIIRHGAWAQSLLRFVSLIATTKNTLGRGPSVSGLCCCSLWLTDPNQTVYMDISVSLCSNHADAAGMKEEFIGQSLQKAATRAPACRHLGWACANLIQHHFC